MENKKLTELKNEIKILENALSNLLAKEGFSQDNQSYINLTNACSGLEKKRRDMERWEEYFKNPDIEKKFKGNIENYVKTARINFDNTKKYINRNLNELRDEIGCDILTELSGEEEIIEKKLDELDEVISSNNISDNIKMNALELQRKYRAWICNNNEAYERIIKRDGAKIGKLLDMKNKLSNLEGVNTEFNELKKQINNVPLKGTRKNRAFTIKKNTFKKYSIKNLKKLSLSKINKYMNRLLGNKQSELYNPTALSFCRRIISNPRNTLNTTIQNINKHNNNKI